MEAWQIEIGSEMPCINSEMLRAPNDEWRTVRLDRTRRWSIRTLQHSFGDSRAKSSRGSASQKKKTLYHYNTQHAQTDNTYKKRSDEDPNFGRPCL